MIYPELYYLVVIAVSAMLVLLIMPSVISIAHKNNLFDDHLLSRKDHGFGIPRLGGIAFYLSIILTSLLTARQGEWNAEFQFYAASIIIFAIGLKDDLSGVHRHTKLFIQAVVAIIITVAGDIRITNLHGIFGLYQLNYWSGIILSILIVIFVVNSFNLIDGIDGLAASLGVVACGTFGVYFMQIGQTSLAALSFSAASALVAFLKFNFSPAKIFMGDAGSLFIGLLCAVLAIKFIGLNHVPSTYSFINAPIIAAAALIIPIFDTASVIFIRLKNKTSPFKPDRNHIHHSLLLLGLSHKQITFLLSSVTLVFIGVASLMEKVNCQVLVLFFAAVLLVCKLIINYLIRHKSKLAYTVGNLAA